MFCIFSLSNALDRQSPQFVAQPPTESSCKSTGLESVLLATSQLEKSKSLQCARSLKTTEKDLEPLIQVPYEQKLPILSEKAVRSKI